MSSHSARCGDPATICSLTILLVTCDAVEGGQFFFIWWQIQEFVKLFFGNYTSVSSFNKGFPVLLSGQVIFHQIFVCQGWRQLLKQDCASFDCLDLPEVICRQISRDIDTTEDDGRECLPKTRLCQTYGSKRSFVEKDALFVYWSLWLYQVYKLSQAATNERHSK